MHIKNNGQDVFQPHLCGGFLADQVRLYVQGVVRITESPAAKIRYLCVQCHSG